MVRPFCLPPEVTCQGQQMGSDRGVRPPAVPSANPTAMTLRPCDTLIRKCMWCQRSRECFQHTWTSPRIGLELCAWVCEHCRDGGRDDDCRVCRRRRRRAAELKQAAPSPGESRAGASTPRTAQDVLDGDRLRAILSATSRRGGRTDGGSRRLRALAAAGGYRRSASLPFAAPAERFRQARLRQRREQ